MSRNAFLKNVREKLNNALLPDAKIEHPGSFNGYSWSPNAPNDALVARFKQELEALHGTVHLLHDVEETAETILKVLSRHGATKILAWENDALGLPNLRELLVEAGVVVVSDALPEEVDGRKAQLADVDEVFVGVTGAHGGLADTGAIGLLSGPNRSRLASLAPPVHIALLRRDQIYPSLPAFLADNSDAARNSSNLVFIAGPSRTGDIEMTLSIGVHGPGEVHVVVLPPSTQNRDDNKSR